jgi:hypothetical protein
MSRYRRRWLIAIVLGGLVAAGLIAWQLSIEKEMRWVYQPEQERLLTERYYIAAQWLAESADLRVETLNSFEQSAWKDDRNATVILRVAVDELDTLADAQLHRFVEAGGQLIAPAPRLYGLASPEQVDQPLNPHGIYACHHYACRDVDEQQLDVSNTPNGESDAQADEDEPDAGWRLIERNDGETVWRLDSRLRLLAADSAEESSIRWQRDQNTEALTASYPIGRGQVHLITDAFLFGNARMLYPDHARLLRALIGKQLSGHAVYIQQRGFQPDFLTWLYLQAPWFWWLALLWLAIWLAFRLPRRGPRYRSLGDEQADRMLDHLLASAQFDGRHNHYTRLLGAMSEARERRCHQRFANWHELDLSARAEQLARLTQAPEHGDAYWMLHTQSARSSKEYLRFTRLHHQTMQALG